MGTRSRISQTQNVEKYIMNRLRLVVQFSEINRVVFNLTLYFILFLIFDFILLFYSYLTLFI